MFNRAEAEIAEGRPTTPPCSFHNNIIVDIIGTTPVSTFFIYKIAHLSKRAYKYEVVMLYGKTIIIVMVRFRVVSVPVKVGGITSVYYLLLVGAYGISQHILETFKRSFVIV